MDTSLASRFLSVGAVAAALCAGSVATAEAAPLPMTNPNTIAAPSQVSHVAWRGGGFRGGGFRGGWGGYRGGYRWGGYRGGYGWGGGPFVAGALAGGLLGAATVGYGYGWGGYPYGYGYDYAYPASYPYYGGYGYGPYSYAYTPAYYGYGYARPYRWGYRRAYYGPRYGYRSGFYRAGYYRAGPYGTRWQGGGNRVRHF